MRRKTLLLFPLVSILLFLSAFSQAQLWTGIVAPSRAVTTWPSAGVVGGIPSGSWAQCGSTIAAYSGSAATINNAIAACGANQFVQLGAGTFNLTSGIDFTGYSNVAVRGQGADATFIVFTGAAGCNGAVSDVCMEPTANNYAGGENNVCNWTGGYAAGSTSITIANCGGTTPAAGNISNLHVGSILVFDQVDEASDTGTIWNCSTENVCSNTIQGGGARADGPCVAGTCNRSQEQNVVVTSITGSGPWTIGISPGIYMPNWRSGQSPQAFYANGHVSNVGLENLSMNHNGSASASHGVEINNCYGCWVSGVRSLYANRSHVAVTLSSHCTVQNSYFYQNISHYVVSYGVEINDSSDSLIQNNIVQQVTDSSPSCTGACEGNVIGYNFAADTQFVTPDWYQNSFYLHAAGDALNLWEGNSVTGFIGDDVHGTHHFETLFRNRFQGWQRMCAGVACTAQTIPINLYAGSRYFNVIGNVLGQTGWANRYQCNAISGAACPSGANPSGTGSDTSIYYTGYTGNGAQQLSSITGFCASPSCSSTGDFDPQVANYLMRWGNYDAVNGSNQFNSSEVPSGISPYGNPVPSSQALPQSFYLNTKPSWWQGEAWPPIGPDVSGGNLGRCSGGSYAGALATSSSQCTGGSLAADVNGQANSIPALDCYLNTMGGAPDGSGGTPLTFNASACYGSSGAQTPPAPTGLTAVVH